MNGYRLIIHSTRWFSRFIGICVLAASAGAAEVVGVVELDHHGLFGSGSGGQAHSISVALVPDQGQRVANRGPQLQQIEIRGNRMHPPFLTAQKGDRVEFVNRDAVFHELFSLSRRDPVSMQLGKAGGSAMDRASFEMTEVGTTHFFCRIHNKSYARIDVVNTPYLKTIQPGQSFRFSDLAPGRWKLRLASPAAETRWVEVRALTAPPPVRLTLASRDGGKGSATLKAQSAVEQLYR